MNDDFVDEYLNKKIDEVLGPNADPARKQQLLDQFQSLILDVVIDNLTDEQVMDLQSLEPNSDEMETKLEQYSASIPNLASIIQQKVDEEFEKLKTTQ